MILAFRLSSILSLFVAPAIGWGQSSLAMLEHAFPDEPGKGRFEIHDAYEQDDDDGLVIVELTHSPMTRMYYLGRKEDDQIWVLRTFYDRSVRIEASRNREFEISYRSQDGKRDEVESGFKRMSEDDLRTLYDDVNAELVERRTVDLVLSETPLLEIEVTRNTKFLLTYRETHVGGKVVVYSKREGLIDANFDPPLDSFRVSELRIHIDARTYVDIEGGEASYYNGYRSVPAEIKSLLGQDYDEDDMAGFSSDFLFYSPRRLASYLR